MSADNGIYIACFPRNHKLGGKEYRVAECQAIENCDVSQWVTLEQAQAFRMMNFGKSKVYLSYQEALQAAKETVSKIDFTEYGVVFLGEFKEEFPYFLYAYSQEELNAIIG